MSTKRTDTASYVSTHDVPTQCYTYTMVVWRAFSAHLVEVSLIIKPNTFRLTSESTHVLSTNLMLTQRQRQKIPFDETV